MGDEKKGGAGVRWAIRLIVLAALAYFFHPLYVPMKSTVPSGGGNDDTIVWRFMEEPSSDRIYQELTLYRDGRNTVTITRLMGDPDMPDGGGWNPKRDGAGEDRLTRFSKANLLEPDKAKRLFSQAIEKGLLDLKAEAATPGAKLTMTANLGGKTVNLTGPSFVPRAYNWFPPVWKNRIRWQNIGLLIKDDTQLKNLLSRKEIILTNE